MYCILTQISLLGQKDQTKQHKIQCLDTVGLGIRKQQYLAFTKKEEEIKRVIFSLFIFAGIQRYGFNYQQRTLLDYRFILDFTILLKLS